MDKTKEQISELVYRAVDEINEDLEPEIQLAKQPDAVLFGSDAKIDSMTLVSLVVAVEDELRSDWGLAVTLANEKAMARQRSPFRTIGSLVEYVQEVLVEAGDE